jgi:dihydroflavonol-4-reductase
MKTLVTGANGFVGAALVRALLNRGHSVRALVRVESNRTNLEGLPIDLATGDVTDRGSIDRAIRGCDAVFHVAADYRLWVPEPERMYRVNVDGTCNVMRAAIDADVERIVYTSSVATLGCLPAPRIADETTPSTLDDMTGHYKRSKFLAEEKVAALVRENSAPVVIVNPSTPVGPGDIRPTPTGQLIRNAAHGRIPAYVDTGLNIVHVDDVAAGHCLALEKGRPGERYILGGDNLTLQQILALIARIAGRAPPRLRLPHGIVLPLAMAAEAWARVAGTQEPFATVDGVRTARKRMFFSSAKAQRELGYEARPAQEALRDAVHWFQRRIPN